MTPVIAYCQSSTRLHQVSWNTSLVILYLPRIKIAGLTTTSHRIWQIGLEKLTTFIPLAYYSSARNNIYYISPFQILYWA